MNVFTEEAADELDAIIEAVIADNAIKGVVHFRQKRLILWWRRYHYAQKMFDIIQTEKAKTQKSNTDVV